MGAETYRAEEERQLCKTWQGGGGGLRPLAFESQFSHTRPPNADGSKKNPPTPTSKREDSGTRNRQSTQRAL